MHHATSLMHLIRGTRSLSGLVALGIVASLTMPADLRGQRPPPRLIPALVARVDGLAANLTPITTMAVQPDGTIMVAQPQDGLIRLFSAAGRAAGSFGRQGAGPKEFRWINTMGWVADTLWVFDDVQRRVTFLAGGKSFLRTTPLPPLSEHLSGDDVAPRVSEIGPVAFLPGGYSLRLGTASVNGQRAVWVDRVRENPRVFLRASPAGNIARVVAMARGGSSQCQDSKLHVPIPECAADLWAVTAAGDRLAMALPIVKDGEQPRVRLVLLNAMGDTLQDRTFPITPIPLSAKSADSIRADRVGNSHSAEAIAGWKAVKIPPYFRPFEYLVVGRDGEVWIGQHADHNSREWLVITSAGAVRGTVTLPKGVRVWLADGDDMWGTADDADDVESVVHYRIIRGK